MTNQICSLLEYVNTVIEKACPIVNKISSKSLAWTILIPSCSHFLNINSFPKSNKPKKQIVVRLVVSKVIKVYVAYLSKEFSILIWLQICVVFVLIKLLVNFEVEQINFCRVIMVWTFLPKCWILMSPPFAPNTRYDVDSCLHFKISVASNK